MTFFFIASLVLTCGLAQFRVEAPIQSVKYVLGASCADVGVAEALGVYDARGWSFGFSVDCAPVTQSQVGER